MRYPESMKLLCQKGTPSAAALVLLIAGCATTARVAQPGLVRGYYHVQRVVDGDTIILTNVGRLRLTVDAPEPGEPGGDEAEAQLIAAIEGKLVLVTFRRRRDGVPVGGRYGRLLATITYPTDH